VLKMPEDQMVEIISQIEGLTKQEKMQIFAYLFDRLDDDDIWEIEQDWIEGLLPELCENVRSYFGVGHN